MALDKWTNEKQRDLFLAAASLPRGTGHTFYRALNRLLADAGFDAYVEEVCEPLYKAGGRPGVPPGVLFRMLFVGYSEGIDSQRGIAWSCTDNLSLQSFLGLQPPEDCPDHSKLTVIRKRLPKELIERVFAFVLEPAFTKKLLKGKIVGMDATTVEASTAMKLILRRDTGDTCMLCLTKLAKEAGLEERIGPIVARRRRSCRRIGFECGDLVAGVLSVLGRPGNRRSRRRRTTQVKTSPPSGSAGWLP